MDEETALAIMALSASVADLAEAIKGLNQNQVSTHTNLVRLSQRLALYEATVAYEQMDNPRGLPN